MGSIDFELRPAIGVAVWPADFDGVDGFCRAESEVEREFVLRVVAVSCADFVDLFSACGFDGDSCSDGASVRFGSC